MGGSQPVPPSRPFGKKGRQTPLQATPYLVPDTGSCFDPHNNPLVLLLLPLQMKTLSSGRRGDLPGATELVSKLVFCIDNIFKYSIIAE